MYLMNVPPIAATHTEWRTCGPPKSYSVPLCCDDSDIDSPSSGTPIAEKVQMIIESLRSSQSSHDMGDQIEGNVLSVQDTHPLVCRGGSGLLLGTRSKGSTENRHTGVSSTVNSESQECDSDDSVDRGIEEAILEYLKEKDDNKGKPEQSTKVPQPSKVNTKISPIPESSKQYSESIKILTASNQFPKIVKVDAPAASSLPLIMKKPFKHKAPFKENPVKNKDTNKGTTGKHSKEQNMCDSKRNNECQTMQSTLFPFIVKTEQQSPDSSSDDGIEEAIQRYQLEKKQSRSSDICKHLSHKEESDSSSDDGIEEAIRTYQLEQLKERSTLKPFLQKQNPVIMSSVSPVQSTSAGKVQKLKSKKKSEKVVKSAFTAMPIIIHKNMPPGAHKDKGIGVLPSKTESLTEQHTHPIPKVNTSAELMCAEAILDISKAVMPRAFSPHVDLSSINPNPSLSLPSSCIGDGSDDSSVDSEDGIEQEIRMFLEQKAQMHKESTSTATTMTGPVTCTNEDKVASKQDVFQRKTVKQSSIQKGKINLVESNVSPKPVMHHKSKVNVAFISLSENGRASRSMLSAQRGPTLPSTGSDAVHRGDKSSSLDSDEDLDTAIKDLLKTKKKLKKKTRDLKLKARKCLKDSEPPPGHSLQAKKLKLEPVPKRAHFKRAHKSGDEMAARSKQSKKTVSPHKQGSKGKEQFHGGGIENMDVSGGEDTASIHNCQPVVKEEEESSSVDSDDSIEQEIRKFLAEKAMVPTVQQSKERDATVNTNVEACVPISDIKVESENQLAEISRNNETQHSDSSLLGCPEGHASQDREAFPNAHKALPQSTDTTPTVIVPSLNFPLANSHGLGTVKTDNCKSTIEGASAEVTRALPRTRPILVHSQSASKWRQSLGLPTTEPRRVCPSRTPLHVTPPRTTERETTSPSLQRGDSGPKPSAVLWSSARGSRSPFCHPAQRPVHYLSPITFFSPLSAARLTPGQLQGHKQQAPVSGQTERNVFVNKSALVELASNRTNHIPVQSRKLSGAKDGEEAPPSLRKRKESESVRPEEDIGAQVGRAEEEFVDETDCELDDRRRPEKKPVLSTLSLSSAIDPGITLEPYIDFTTEARSKRFSRKCIPVNGKENKTLKQVKRKLQFVPVSRYMIRPT